MQDNNGRSVEMGISEGEEERQGRSDGNGDGMVLVLCSEVAYVR